MQVEKLENSDAARDYYEQRYANGYMDVWGTGQRNRLLAVLAQLDLPPSARVLDFGCGSGAITKVLREAFPDAKVHGADISSVAISAAKERVAGATFDVLDEKFLATNAGTFDLVFSHHVLEHVFDLDATIVDLASLCATGGSMLHALPCGNDGSLANWLCRQRPDGIDPTRGDRFFFEEASHLRRLRSDQLETAFSHSGATTSHASFAHHWFGVLRMMTEMAPADWFAMANPMRCHRRSLPAVATLLLAIACIAALRAPTQVLLRTHRAWRQVFCFRTRSLRSARMLFALALPAVLLAPISLPIEALVRALDAREWRRRRHDPRGAEMFLQFTMASTPSNALDEEPKRTEGTEPGTTSSTQLIAQQQHSKSGQRTQSPQPPPQPAPPQPESPPPEPSSSCP